MQKINISDTINSEYLDYFYIDYDNWCKNLLDGLFYIEHLSKEQFLNRIKTYGDWLNLQKDVGMIDDDRI